MSSPNSRSKEIISVNPRWAKTQIIGALCRIFELTSGEAPESSSNLDTLIFGLKTFG
jgi:hypothetical protein